MNKVEQLFTDQTGQSVIFSWLRRTIQEGWKLNIQLGRDSTDNFNFGSDPIVRRKTSVFAPSDFVGVDDTTLAIPVLDVPPRSVIKFAAIEVIEGFTGGDVTAITATLAGTNGVGNVFNNQNVIAATAVINSTEVLAYTGSEVSLTFNSTGDNLENLEAGQLAVHVYYDTLP